MTWISFLVGSIEANKIIFRYLVAACILIVFSFIVFRVIVRNDYCKKRKLTFISYSLEVLVFALHANFIYLYIPAKWPNLPPFPENLLLRIISIVFILIGFLIVAVAMLGLGYRRTMGQDKKILKTNGLYKYSRNPQLVGYGMILIALVLFDLSLFSLGWFIMYLIISYFMIKTEEEFLTTNYGEEYLKYCNNVPRLIRLFLKR